ILQKPGALDESEFAVIKRHPDWGVKLLRELGGFNVSARELVHSHHERLDGKGYPRGLAAGAIGLDTRLLTRCDVYDALGSARGYRPVWTPQAALDPLCVYRRRRPPPPPRRERLGVRRALRRRAREGARPRAGSAGSPGVSRRR